MSETYNKWLFAFIITLPIIDMLTTFTIHWPLSIGAIVRPIIMLLVIVWLIRHKRTEGYIIFIPFIWLISSFNFQLLTKEPFLLFDELQFYVKTAYYVTMILFVYLYNNVQFIKLNTINKAIQIVAIMLATSFWFSLITNSSLMSYPYDKSGFSGWFFAANELSVIVLIILSLTIIAYLDDRNIFSLFSLIAILSVTPMIGTKTAFFGALILISITSVLIILRRKTNEWLPIVILGLLFIISLPVTPALQNTAFITSKVISNEDTSALLTTNNSLLSSRDTYLANTKQMYDKSSFMNKWFGLGYAGIYDSHPKMIEMDFYDLFFSFGILGTIVLLYPLSLVTLQVIQLSSITISYVILLITYLLCLFIAFYVGHVLFAPAVMSYIAILLIRLKITLTEMNNYE